MAEAELAEAAEAALATTQLRWRPGWRRWSWCDEALARRKPRPFTIILERRNAKAQNSYRERISQILLAQMESNAMMGLRDFPELGRRRRWYARKSDNPSQAFR